MSAKGPDGIIREEAAGDGSAIYSLTKAAFADMPYSEGDEHQLVDRLRADGDLALSLVCDLNGDIIGHIAFSPVVISGGGGNWYGLGPVSVAPSLQRNGVGGRIIRRGLAMMEERGAQGIVLLGNPEYYSRFGFVHDPALQYPGPPAEYFQRLVMHGSAPAGTVCFANAFD